MQPKVYTFQDHQIPLRKIDSSVLYVIQKLREAGFKAYLVGGGVRDLLLNQTPKDFDVSTSAKPEEIRALFRNCILIGRRFRLAHIRFGKKVIEVATFRSGDTGTADLIIRDNQWGTEEEDVLRRDFTINGLFYDPQEELVIDYVEGFADIEKRILRTIGHPEVRFVQDPVRMIRLLKFCARFDFEIQESTHLALLSCKEHILKSSATRILEELMRMLESGSSQGFFHLLHQYGLLKLLLPRLSTFLDKDDQRSVLQMLGEVDVRMRKSHPDLPDRSLSLSALCYPLLETQLQSQTLREKAPFHLGFIAQQTNDLLTHLFSPFFRLPRRLRGMMVFLLSTQFRFVPLHGKNIRRPRLPKEEELPLALELLNMRCALQPNLLPAYALWSEALFQSRQNTDSSLPKRPARKRGRRNRKKESEV